MARYEIRIGPPGSEDIWGVETEKDYLVLQETIHKSAKDVANLIINNLPRIKAAIKRG